MEERETQARWRAGGAASPPARWLALSSAAALVGLAVTAAPAGSGVAVGGLAADQTVNALPSNQFDRPDITVTLGETVTWMNKGGFHNVRFDDGSFDQPADPSTSAWSVKWTPSSEGTFRYYCEAHGAVGGIGMAGQVTVTAAAPPPPGGYPPPPPSGGPPPPGGGPPPPGAPTPEPGPAPGTGKAATTVTLKVNDATPKRGAQVRFFGIVKPAQDGRFLQLQRRSRGTFRTVVRIKLTDAGASRSKFSKRLRVPGDAAFRARLPADDAHALGTSRTRRLDVG